MLNFLQEAFLIGVNNMYNTNKSLNDDLVKKKSIRPSNLNWVWYQTLESKIKKWYLVKKQTKMTFY